jgi:hypothetical protein
MKIHMFPPSGRVVGIVAGRYHHDNLPALAPAPLRSRGLSSDRATLRDPTKNYAFSLSRKCSLKYGRPPSALAS